MSLLLLTGKRTLTSSLLPSFPKTHARLTRKYDVRSREFLNLRKIRRELRGTINLCQRGIDMEDIRYEFDKSPGEKILAHGERIASIRETSLVAGENKSRTLSHWRTVSRRVPPFPAV